MSVATNELAPAAMDGEAVARELFRNIRTVAEHLRSTLDAAFAELESLTELVIRAHDARVWRRVNHMSWEDCCKKEFGAIRLLRLPREMRKELHLALRDGGLGVRHTAAVTGCSKNTVLEDCSSQKPSQTGTPERDDEKGDDAPAREPDGDNVTLADPPRSNVKYLNPRHRPASSRHEPASANGARVDGYGPTDPLERVAGAARAVSCDIANLVSLTKLARRDGRMPAELADYLGPKVATWINTLGSLVVD